MSYLYRILFLLLACLPYCLQAQQASPNYVITHYSTDNGLPQNSVTDIAFDKAGYCWLTTEMGLVRFDGKNFRTFGTAEIPGLRSERMGSLGVDEHGNVYVRADNNQLMVIKAGQGSYSSFPQLSPHQELRIATNNRLVSDKALIREIDRLQVGKATDWVNFCYLPGGEVYFFNDGGLHYYTPGQKQVRQLKAYEQAPLNNPIPLNDECILQLSNPRDKPLVWRHGVLQSQWTAIRGLDAKELASGKLVSGYGEGVFFYVKDRVYRISVREGVLVADLVLEHIQISNPTFIVYRPAQRQYYIGSTTDGLLAVQLSDFQYAALPASITDQSFYAQSKLSDTSLFVRDMVLSPDHAPRQIATATGGYVASCVTADKQLYFEHNFVLKKYDLKNWAVRKILDLNGRLRYIHPASQGNSLFFCTDRHFGQLSNDTLAAWVPFPGNMKILDMIPLDNQYFLLATESGLKWYRYKDNKIDRSILDSIVIRTALPDADGRIWIASYGKGFYLYEKGKIVPMPWGPLDALKTVHAFIEDAGGYFWLPTNNGLFRVKKSELLDYAQDKSRAIYFYRFSKENGLRTNEFNGGCDPVHVWLKDSLLSLPSINGLVWFYPSKARVLYPENKIYIDRLLIDNQRTDDGAQLLLPPDFSSLSLVVSCPYFGNAENLQLEYCLKGLQDTWRPLPDNGLIFLNNLPAGSYQIIVRKRAYSHEGTAAQLVLPLTVKSWFYNTWWFYGLALLAIALGVYLLIRTRERALKKRALQLEAQVGMRTMELNEAVSDLERSEVQLLKSNRTKDQVITMVLHDLRSPLRFINTISNYLSGQARTISRDELVTYLADLKSGSKALDQFTRDFFTWAVSQQEGFKVEKVRFPLTELFADLEELYKEIAASNDNALVVKKTDLSCVTDYQILAFVLRNLLDNANKNTRKGSITLSAEAIEDDVRFTIADTGKGMTAGQIDDYMNDMRDIGTQKTGSILVLQMLQLIGGKLEIDSEPGRGSTFSVMLLNCR